MANRPGVLCHDWCRVQLRWRDGIEERDAGLDRERLVPTRLPQLTERVSMRQLGIVEQVLDMRSRAGRDANRLQLCRPVLRIERHGPLLDGSVELLAMS
jgi:hypothetical protein